MLRKRSDTGELRPGSKVVALDPIGKVPAGTHGVVKLVDGFKWIRYWVAWDTGDWIGSIDGSQIVAAGRYEDFQRERAEATERAATQASVPAAATAGEAPDAAAPASVSKIPEHLLERSRQARARKAESA